ncbi:MAG: hypothetical protein LBI84_08780 [Propionibacteriaceae bacterium]|nr:hypothetical protein [Propionibacteriaceae bacterium]
MSAAVTDEGGELTAASEQLRVILGETGEYDGAQGYLSLVFLALGTVIALAAAGNVTSVLRQEALGQSRALLARPVSRIALLGADVAADLATLAVATAGAAAGVWLALLSQKADLSFPDCLLAMFTWMSAAVVTYSLGIAAIGWLPQIGPGLAYAFATCSFLLDLIGSAVKAPEWLLRWSFWRHVPDVPRTAPEWDFFGWSWLAAAALVAAGIAGYRHRDLQT